MSRTLVCWIGLTDVRASMGKEEGLGPIGRVVTENEFDSVELISNLSPVQNQNYVKWLSGQCSTRVNVHDVELVDPMDFGRIYELSDQLVEKLLAERFRRLVFHLSPGTSAMTAIWLLLATSKYPVDLIASSKERGVYVPNFPFELAADYVPRKRAAVRGDEISNAFEVKTPPEFESIIHRCQLMKQVIARAKKVAGFDVPVMILGETGTGKELFAKAIHSSSPRHAAPFVPVNCGAIPSELVESELFGHVKGAFTGATEHRDGYFVQAHRGTLFLDELGELPLATQVKLLRVLQTGKVVPVGGSAEKSVDVRVVSATHKDLDAAVEAGRFREDLYHRLAVGIITLPPLRKRREDLGLLIDFKLKELQTSLQKGMVSKLPVLSPGAKTLLKQQAWPGNIRELFNTITRAVIWCEGDVIEKADIEAACSSLAGRNTVSGLLDHPLSDGFSVQELLANVERHYIERALLEADTHKAAAKLLGYDSDPAMKYRMRALGISSKGKKKSFR